MLESVMRCCRFTKYLANSYFWSLAGQRPLPPAAALSYTGLFLFYPVG